jgi:phage repressor protein C with HTH and peptisase S24 domain
METSVKQRLIQFIKYKGIGQGKFEKAVGLSNGFVNNIRVSITPEKLQKIALYYPELNKSWLLTGEGEMLNNEIQKTAEKDLLSDYETYLLPMTTHAGGLNEVSADGTLLQNCEKVISPIKGVDFAITVYGESMAPEYPSGSRLLIKRIDPSIFIDWGKVFVLDTSNGVIVKEVHTCEKEGYVTCHSINPDPKYADFIVPLSEVYGMYRVLMCLSAK